MAQLVCPRGHESAEEDFCSVCGSKMTAPPPPPAECPGCGAQRQPADAAFCENCGYSFSAGASEPKPADVSWRMTIDVDSSLRSEESPEPPPGFAPITLLMDKNDMSIGRRSEKRASYPEISLDFDDAVSHRHAVLNRAPDGSWLVKDVGSSNGTKVNGTELQPLAETALKEGDRITLGHWTSLTISRGNA